MKSERPVVVTHLGAEVRRRRLDKGLTQTELGDLVGSTQSDVSAFERGVIKNPHVGRLSDYAAALDTTVTELAAAVGMSDDEVAVESVGYALSSAKARCVVLLDRVEEPDARVVEQILIRFARLARNRRGDRHNGRRGGRR